MNSSFKKGFVGKKYIPPDLVKKKLVDFENGKTTINHIFWPNFDNTSLKCYISYQVKMYKFIKYIQIGPNVDKYEKCDFWLITG